MTSPLTLKVSTDSKTATRVVIRTTLQKKTGKTVTKTESIANATGHYPGAQDGGCPGATAACDPNGNGSCYVGVEGKKTQRRGREAVTALLRHNLKVILETATEDRWMELADILTTVILKSEAQQLRAGVDAPLFRHHWSGDIVNVWHAKAIAEAARRTPKTDQWIYTRSFWTLGDIVGIPNLRVLVSADVDNVKVAEAASKLYPGVQVAYMGAGVQSTDRRAIVCPASSKGNVVKSRKSPSGLSGICSTCRACINTVATPDITFQVH